MENNFDQTELLLMRYSEAPRSLPVETVLEILGLTSSVFDAVYSHNHPLPQLLQKSPGSAVMSAERPPQAFPESFSQIPIRDTEKPAEQRSRQDSETPDPQRREPVVQSAEGSLGSYTSARYSSRPGTPELRVHSLGYGSPLQAIFEGDSSIVFSIVDLYRNVSPLVAPYLQSAHQTAADITNSLVAAIILDRMNRRWKFLSPGNKNPGEYWANPDQNKTPQRLDSPSGNYAPIHKIADEVPEKVIRSAGPVATSITLSLSIKFIGLEFSVSKTTH